LANVENVVNPPQKPTARNIFQPGVSKELRSEKPYISPIRRHPEYLQKKSRKGKLKEDYSEKIVMQEILIYFPEILLYL